MENTLKEGDNVHVVTETVRVGVVAVHMQGGASSSIDVVVDGCKTAEALVIEPILHATDLEGEEIECEANPLVGKCGALKQMNVPRILDLAMLE